MHNPASIGTIPDPNPSFVSSPDPLRKSLFKKGIASRDKITNTDPQITTNGSTSASAASFATFNSSPIKCTVSQAVSSPTR
jgi:hypothetical protein